MQTVIGVIWCDFFVRCFRHRGCSLSTTDGSLSDLHVEVSIKRAIKLYQASKRDGHGHTDTVVRRNRHDVGIEIEILVIGSDTTAVIFNGAFFVRFLCTNWPCLQFGVARSRSCTRSDAVNFQSKRVY
jgi:hypothetical protein